MILEVTVFAYTEAFIDPLTSYRANSLDFAAFTATPKKLRSMLKTKLV